MQRRLPDPRVGTVRVEATRQHRFERPDVVTLGRLVKRDVVVVRDLVAQFGIPGEERLRRRAVAATARRDELVDLRQLRRRAMREQPVGHRPIPVQLGDRVRRPPIGALALDVGPPRHHRLGQRHIPRARHHMQRRLTVLGEHRVRVGAVLE